MTYMLLLNCALKLVEEIILYYDARPKKTLNYKSLYVSSFGLHVLVNYMTIIRSIRAKIEDMQQSISWNAMGSNWVLHNSV